MHFNWDQLMYNSGCASDCDISKGFQGFLDCMKPKKVRELAISPFHVNGGDHKIPVTPILNPLTELSSHHIIRLINGPTGRYRVDLFIRDGDSYFLAFRREIVLTEEEIQQGRVGGWGRWHRFHKATVPYFLNARNIGITLSYGESDDITPGGSVALEDIYYTFGRFGDNSVAGRDIERVSYLVMAMFCETTRPRSLLLEVGRRIRDDTMPTMLRELLWSRIKKWAHLCRVVLEGRLGNLLGLHLNLPDWCQQNLGLNTMNDLIGRNGEVMLIKHNFRFMGLTNQQISDLERADGAGNVVEPGFQVPPAPLP